MKKRLIAAGFLGAFLVTGLQAGRNRPQLKTPVCRFIEFYTAPEASEMSSIERILYGIAIAAKKPAQQRCGASTVAAALL